MPLTKRPGQLDGGRRLRVESLEPRRVLATFTVSTELDVVDPDDGVLSLREAIAEANAAPGADQITFDFGHDGPAVIDLEQGQLEITESLTITGDGPELLTIDAQQESRIFLIDDELETLADVELRGMTLVNGRSDSNGGAIWSSENLSVVDSLLTRNATVGEGMSAGGGGAIFLSNGELIVDHSTLSGNVAGEGATPQPEYLGFDREFVGGWGGAILSESALDLDTATVTVTDSRIETNVAYGSSGGGVFGVSVVVERSFILDNSALSSNIQGLEGGGGVFGLRGVEVSDSFVVGNWTEGYYVRGGGIRAESREVRVTRSVVADNHTFGDASNGGGIFSITATIIDSTIDGNSTRGKYAEAGGIQADSLFLVRSAVTNNWTSGDQSDGGGVRARWSSEISHSTISGNQTFGEQSSGAGIVQGGPMVLSDSTVTNNHARHDVAWGGGIDARYGSNTVVGSIIAGNTASWAPDIGAATVTESTYDISYSVVGIADDLAIDGVGNLTGTAAAPLDPLLGPLADHGGSTLTHALLPGSPALDAGDPSVVYDPETFDQRGAGFVRVSPGGVAGSGRIDIGAFESQGIPIDFPAGDYNHNGIADAADYTLWRDSLGEQVAPGAGADGDADGQITIDDYHFWRDHFGNAEVPTALPPAEPVAASAFASFGLESFSAGVWASNGRPHVGPMAESTDAGEDVRPARRGLPTWRANGDRGEESPSIVRGDRPDSPEEWARFEAIESALAGHRPQRFGGWGRLL